MSGIPELDYIGNAIEYFSKILSLYKCSEKSKKNINEFTESFNTRARNGPQMIRDEGIIPYLTFLASKSGNQLIKEIHRLLRADEIKCEMLRINLDREAGYAVYFDAILFYLEKLGVIRIDGELSITKIIQKLFESIHEYRAVEPLLIRYLVELKKLSSAYFN